MVVRKVFCISKVIVIKMFFPNRVGNELMIYMGRVHLTMSADEN